MDLHEFNILTLNYYTSGFGWSIDHYSYLNYFLYNNGNITHYEILQFIIAGTIGRLFQSLSPLKKGEHLRWSYARIRGLGTSEYLPTSYTITPLMSIRACINNMCVLKMIGEPGCAATLNCYLDMCTYCNSLVSPL